MKKILIGATMLALSIQAATAAPFFAWAATRTGTTADGFDYAIGAKSDAIGNVYVVSNVYNNASPNDYQDVHIDKYSPNGTSFGPGITIDLHGFDDRAYDMEIDAAGNIYVVGFTALDSTLTDTNIFVRKYAESGALLWSSEIVPGANNKDEYAYDVLVDGSGNVYVAGETPGGAGQFVFDGLVRKYNSAGVVQWTSTTTGSNAAGYDAFTGLSIHSSGDVFATGEFSNSVTVDDQDMKVVRLTAATGFPTFNVNYNSAAGASFDTPFDVETDASGNVWVAGITISTFSPNVLQNGWIRKYSSVGVLLGNNSFNGTGTGRTNFNDILPESSGGVLVAGDTMTGTTESSSNALLVRYTSTVTQNGFNTFNGPGGDEDRGNNVFIQPNGNLLVAGTVDVDANIIANDRNMMLWELNGTTLGTIGTQYYNNVSDWDVTESARLGNDGAIFLAGNSYVTFTDSNALVAKYAQQIRVNPTSFTVVQGTFFGGSLASLFNSDNNSVFVLNDENDSTGEIRFATTSPTLTPSLMTCRFEAAATRNDLTQFTSCFRYTTNSWVQFDSRTTTLTDVAFNFNVASPVSYVNQTTGQMQTRIVWIPQADLEAADGWSETVDQAVWDIVN